jgi:integrase
LHAARLDTRPVGQITVEEVANVLRPIWTGPGHGQGSRLRGLLERIFRAQGVEPNPAQWTRLEDLLSRKAVKVESHPSLPYAQLPAFMVELAAVPSIPARALRFLILTGVRAQEAIGARWEEIDLEQKLWTIPAARMKMKEAHTVPLGAAAIACLGSRGSGFVFPATRGEGRTTRSALNKTLAKFKRADVTGRLCNSARLPLDRLNMGSGQRLCRAGHRCSART